MPDAKQQYQRLITELPVVIERISLVDYDSVLSTAWLL